MTPGARIRDWLRASGTLLALCVRAHPWGAAALLASELAADTLWLLATYAIKLMVDAAVSRNVVEVFVVAVVLAASATLALLCYDAYTRVTLAVIERSGELIDAHLMELATRAETIERYDRPEYANVMALIQQERGQLAQLLNAVGLNVRVFLYVLGAVLILIRIAPLLAALPLFAIPGVIAHRVSSRIARRARERNAEPSRVRDHLYRVAAAPAAGPELRIYGLVDELARRHREVAEGVVRETTRASLQAMALTALGLSAFAVGYVGALVVVLEQVAAGRTTIGSVVMAISLAMLISSQIAFSAQMSRYLEQVLEAGSRLLWLRTYTRPQAHNGAAPQAPERLRDGIRLGQVSFTYYGSSAPALDRVDLHLRAGSVVALVGENGSGKTTLVKLLTGLYRPTSGTIAIDGTDVARIDAAAWRTRVSAAFQDFQRFELLLGEAVGIGDLPRSTDRDAVRAALARADGDDLVQLSPDGLSAQLGAGWGGLELSGGQWQKLALGRALMPAGPLLIAFDEPNAALDAEAEHAVFERIAEAARSQSRDGRITLLVTHRFANVSIADLIVVLDAGRVVEIGDHARLMRNGGLYAELYEIQSRGYQ